MNEDADVVRAGRAEEGLAAIRAAVVLVNSVAYLFFLASPPMWRDLALAIIVIANVYSAVILVGKPYRRFPVLASAWFTTATDSVLITVWLFATGDVASPFFVLWYVSLAAIAFRFDWKVTTVAAVVYAASYLALGWFTSGVDSEVVLRSTYVLLLGAVGALLAQRSLEDVTARFAMRARVEAVETAQEALRDSEGRYRLLFEANPSPLWVYDLETLRILAVNDAATHHYGYTRDEFLAMTIRDLRPPEDLARLEKNLAKSGSTYEWSSGWQHRKKDGTIIDVEIVSHAIEFGNRRGRLVLAQDVTERRRAESERLTSQSRLAEVERLRELDEFKTRFINMAAHELKTPLTPIRLQLHILRENRDDAASRLRSVDVLDRNFERLTRLVDEVLDVARLEAQQLVLDYETVDLNRIVLETVDSYEEQANAQNVRLEATVSPDLRIEADPHRLTQVLFNLVGNALKFTPPGGRVTVETRRTHDGVALIVRDTGQGIDPALIPKLFKPFVQVHDRREKTEPGTGLGLFICRSIVELHGGSISCESEGPGSGTEFRVSLPLGPKASSRPETTPRARRSDRAAR